MTTPTPQQAKDLLSQVESNQTQARSSDAWPLVTMLFVYSAAVSVGIVAVGVIEDNTTQLIILGAGGAWLAPAIIVYVVKALSWSRRSTILLCTWLPLTFIAFSTALIVDSFTPSSWVPFAAAGFLWVISPIMALFGLRR
ncbi:MULTISPECIES: hypothetical protein [Brevibacterium]|uniref:Uncharacterized protein n=1 Tax=Brevibacterium antiquum CNRZ 918 TaxID=1255637 RepID=A0A2H1IY79_9MICO|nr:MULTISPECIES: hypothetical protein [Brevibacterium]SMX79942.1 hypothetical protein BANT918_01187 [Brevibacterium antiquum CNRZ 918]HCG56447.1 hypothetical protein [Brevibacterium sp.]